MARGDFTYYCIKSCVSLLHDHDLISLRLVRNAPFNAPFLGVGSSSTPRSTPTGRPGDFVSEFDAVLEPIAPEARSPREARFEVRSFRPKRLKKHILLF